MYINFITKANDYNTQPHFLTHQLFFCTKKYHFNTSAFIHLFSLHTDLFFRRCYSWKVCILFSGGSNTVCEFEVWNVWKGLKSLVLVEKFWFEKFRISICFSSKFVIFGLDPTLKSTKSCTHKAASLTISASGSSLERH